MQEVKTMYNGKIYTYKNLGGIFTWFDARNLAVPVMVHSSLREKALSEGADISIFLSTPKPPRSEIPPNIKEPNEEQVPIAEQPKKKLPKTLGFNPFSTGE